MLRLLSLVVVTSELLMVASVFASEPQTDPASKRTHNRNYELELIKAIQQAKLNSAILTYDSQIAHYRIYGVVAKFVIQSNSDLLKASLVAGIPNAAIDYERRAREIEELAQKSVRLGAAPKEDLSLAKSARLDAMLEGFLIPSDANDN